MDEWLLIFLIFITAILYSAVGHAGASGYLAVMALLGVAQSQMRPAALILNIIVATIGTIRFYRAGLFSWQLFLPFTVASIPFAWLGGYLNLPSNVYRPVIGIILLLSATKLVSANRIVVAEEKQPVPLPLAAISGAVIGLLAGLTGTGGGIFLSPLLSLMRWAETRETSAVTIAFVLCNSLFGLIGLLSTVHSLPIGIFTWAFAVVVGAVIGTELGSRRLSTRTLRRILAMVLVIAGLKMIFT
jgi:hypothetical protein